MHALHVSGFAPNPLALRWIADAVAEYRGPNIGLYDGATGVAWLWRSLGLSGLADEVTDKLLGIDLEWLTSDLYGGLAGVGLYLLSEFEHRSDADRLDAAIADIFEILASRAAELPSLGSLGPQPAVPTGRGGLLWGQSGISMFASRLYRRTADRRHLDLAQFTLDYDLAHCISAGDGSIQMNEGWRILPYLGSGSIGCGLALLEFLGAGGSQAYVEPLKKIERVTKTEFVIEPSVYNGRCGLLLFLAELERSGMAGPEASKSFAWHLGQLRLHALKNKIGIAFPGEQMIRLSTDIGSGASGVLLTLEVARRRLGGAPHSAEDLLPLIIGGQRPAHQVPTTQEPREEVSPDGIRTRTPGTPEHRQHGQVAELVE